MAAGVLLVAAGQLDLFLTVLSYEGYGPLSHRLYRGTWDLIRGIGRALPAGPRSWLLSLAAPAMVVASVLMWIGLTLLGFALIYWPSMPRNFETDGGVGTGFWDAVYTSGVSLSTLGFGDVTPTEPLFQILTVVEALMGFSILTLAISYILGVYGIVGQGAKLGTVLFDRAGQHADPLSLTRSFLGGDGQRGVSRRIEELHRELIEYHEGLHRYPVVYYFRSRLRHRSMPYVFGMVAGFAAALRWGLPSGHPVSADPALIALLRGATRITDEITSRFVPGDVSDPPWSEPMEESRFGANEDDELSARFRTVSAVVTELAGDCDPHDGARDDPYRRYRDWLDFSARVHRFVHATAGDLGYGMEDFDRTPQRARPG